MGALIALLLATFGVALSAPASAAASRNGKCESGEFCYYYHSKEYGYGSVSDFSSSHGHYFTDSGECYHFLGAGDGKGECVKNLAAAVQNLTGKTVRVYANAGYAGTYQDVKPGFKGNLISALWHNNESHKILSSSYSLPVSRSVISRGDLDNPHWGGYPAIDIIVSYVPVYALRAATVHYWNSDTCGIGLRFDVGDNFRYVYCHLSKRAVSDGAKVSAGQRVGTSGQTGNAQQSVPHLHIEIRNGSSNSDLYCPQQWLLAVWDGKTPPTFSSLPKTGCTA